VIAVTSAPFVLSSWASASVEHCGRHAGALPAEVAALVFCAVLFAQGLALIVRARCCSPARGRDHDERPVA